MAEEKKKPKVKGKQTAKPSGSKKDEISEKDLDKVSGGLLKFR